VKCKKKYNNNNNTIKSHSNHTHWLTTTKRPAPKMRVLALSNSLPTLPSSSSETPKPPILCNFITTHNNIANCAKKSLTLALSGALSFGLLFSSPCSIALVSPTIQSPSSSSELCREDERVAKAETRPEAVTNEGIVEEAWEIVNESFIDTGRHRWSPQTWLVMHA
jgi:carboxyl-terminal processing protease